MGCSKVHEKRNARLHWMKRTHSYGFWIRSICQELKLKVKFVASVQLKIMSNSTVRILVRQFLKGWTVCLVRSIVGDCLSTFNGNWSVLRKEKHFCTWKIYMLAGYFRLTIIPDNLLPIRYHQNRHHSPISRSKLWYFIKLYVSIVVNKLNKM